MKQKVITPQIKKCFCGSETKFETDEYGQELVLRVCCIENNHHFTKYCGTRHKAVCKWNNRVENQTKY